MLVKELKEMLNTIDENLELFYNEPIMGTVITFDKKIEVMKMYQDRDGNWFSQEELAFIKKETPDAIDTENMIGKDQAFLIDTYDNNMNNINDYFEYLN